ncbi:MAG: pyruvate dehydrogenase (acetyl-transferring) E1 component subunit alpha [Acidothermus sp.]|nr:pyruvate dehydrogenase (acetyl-transferring) E1 component subunit alpha [Acidothermus sp.]MCL6538941.1 pyruvate dehydrogenase (acetyl-transferring) E1 component subunit alpha [Acidothermus sp.]
MPAASRKSRSTARGAADQAAGASATTGAGSTDQLATTAADRLRGEPADRLRGYYRMMQLIRRFEERAAEMYQRAKIGGYCHLNLGEEATIVGLMDAMAPQDYLFTTYREHGYAIARGIDPGRVMAELFGRTTGTSKGWGGSMHLFDTEVRLLGGYGIVGGQIPPATGAALAITYREAPGPDSPAVVCLVGDATTNIGAWHESLNLAGIWHLPIVYVIINNQLGMGTPVEKASAEPDLYKRGCAYRIPGVRVDGNDAIACREALRDALRKAREDRAPSIVETVSYRLRGHSVVDPARYRSKEEAQRLLALDPVAAFRKRLIELGVLTEEDAARLDAEVDAEVDAAVEFADNSPHPSPAELFAHAYAQPVPNMPRALPGDPLLPVE